MAKMNLPLVLIGIGIFTILISGKPNEFSFQELGDTLTGIIFIIIGTTTYLKNKKTRDNK